MDRCIRGVSTEVVIALFFTLHANPSNNLESKYSKTKSRVIFPQLVFTAFIASYAYFLHWSISSRWTVHLFYFRQQWLSEKDSADKLKSYSQQQAQRASNAEVSAKACI